MILVFTGNGKGKTTASFGVALRASGWEKKVAILQFIKEEGWPEGAREAIRKHLPNIEIEALGSGFVGIMGDEKPTAEHLSSARQAYDKALTAVSSGKYDLVVLDELLGALHGGFITREDIENILRAHLDNRGKPKSDSQKSEADSRSIRDQDLIITGRHAPEWLIDKADLVTEMKEIKHPFSKGDQAKKGIDF